MMARVNIHEPIFGCMDSTATNFDSEATEDDGSYYSTQILAVMCSVMFV